MEDDVGAARKGSRGLASEEQEVEGRGLLASGISWNRRGDG